MDGRLAEKLLYLYFPLKIFNWLHLFGEVAKNKKKHFFVDVKNQIITFDVNDEYMCKKNFYFRDSLTFKCSMVVAFSILLPLVF